jgi:scyllo-inositol 2-dehydrogenase (NADP+)
MNYLIVGLGNIGAKRRAVLGGRCVATVDPFNPDADFVDAAAVDPARYDAVVLSTPNHVKLELLEYFLEGGKSVLVEKPLIFPDDETAVALQRIGHHTGAIWYTSYNFRFEPNVVALKRLLDAGAIGPVYRAHLFYGNGTAGAIAGTWRDTPLAVLEDVASHLVDLAGFVFGRFGSEFLVWERRAHELKGPDHCILATPDRALVIESSFLAWKNRWSITVVGHDGSIEMNGLTKWGSSELIVRRRRFPSGAPDEHRDVVAGPDPTWASDLRYFEECVAAGRSSYDNDQWLSRTIRAAAGAPLEAGER